MPALSVTGCDLKGGAGVVRKRTGSGDEGRATQISWFGSLDPERRGAPTPVMSDGDDGHDEWLASGGVSRTAAPEGGVRGRRRCGDVAHPTVLTETLTQLNISQAV